MLDFTFSPLVALYFAAISAIENRDGHVHTIGDSIAVWGIDLDLLVDSNQLSVVQVPKGRNPFLRAQQGFFIFDPWASHGKDAEESPSIDRRVIELQTRVQQKANRLHARMIKYTAPLGVADEVLYLLSLENVDKPHLMPTFDNVVHFLRSQRRAGLADVPRV